MLDENIFDHLDLILKTNVLFKERGEKYVESYSILILYNKSSFFDCEILTKKL